MRQIYEKDANFIQIKRDKNEHCLLKLSLNYYTRCICPFLLLEIFRNLKGKLKWCSVTYGMIQKTSLQQPSQSSWLEWFCSSSNRHSTLFPAMAIIDDYLDLTFVHTIVLFSDIQREKKRKLPTKRLPFSK